MVLTEAIDAYVADRRTRGYSRGTIDNNRRMLRHFLAAVGNVDTKSLRPQHIDAFWAFAEGRGWAPGTLNVARDTLAGFFTWLSQRGYMRRDIDLLAGTRAFRVPDRTWITIPQEKFTTFLEGAEDARARITLAIGLYLFTRISETEQLRWQDVDLDGHKIEVFRQKTGKIDTLPICAELAHELRLWRLAYAEMVGAVPTPGWFVIPGREHGFRKVPGQTRGFGFNPESLQPFVPSKRPILGRVIRDELTRAGYYQKHEGGHTLRRSGAIALYDQLSSVGHDRAIRVCQAMLGHASIKTTEIYLKLDLDRKVRNDLLSGKPMFPSREEAQVVQFRQEAGGGG